MTELNESLKRYVPLNYIKTAADASKTCENERRTLLEQRKLPDAGWGDYAIESFVSYLSSLDSNNFPKKCGVGEREGRIVCRLVAQRHYNFGHGIGRSGNLEEAQPKAVGSTVLNKLTNDLVLDLIRKLGISAAKRAIIVPMATGMTLALCLTSLKRQRPPTAKYVLWSRIDQKSCFKSISAANLTPVIIQTRRNPDTNGLETDVSAFEEKIVQLGAENIVAIFSTTSCFAPRECDNLEALAKLAAKHSIAHLVNNAYGMQSTDLCRTLHRAACGNGRRIDLFVQSTDKNLMVPVGGAIVCGFDPTAVDAVANCYAGRASSSQSLDVLMTLLSLGWTGYKSYVSMREKNVQLLKDGIADLYEKFSLPMDHNFLGIKNSISVAIPLRIWNSEHGIVDVSGVGSMLFTRGVSGSRLITGSTTSSIDGFEFVAWGGHINSQPTPYLTAGVALGCTEAEISNFLSKLSKILTQCINSKKTIHP